MDTSNKPASLLTPRSDGDFYALLTEFEQLVLDANDSELPRRAQLPVSKRLNEVRAKLQVFGALSETKYPTVDADAETATIFVAFRRYTEDEPAKVVQRQVAACVDYDAAGNMLGVEIFDVLPEPK